MTISTTTIVGLTLTALFAVAFPTVLLIMWKLRHKEISLLCALAGAVTFVAWALVLEQLLHMVMIPIVSANAVAYTVYASLASGIFEETGRFLTFKLFLEKSTASGDPRNAVMYGIGHGGIEAILIVALPVVSSVATAVMYNAGALDAALADPSSAAAVSAQIDTIAATGAVQCLLSVLERLVAITFHISMSVIVFAAVSKKKLWLYPAAILAHALLNSSAALAQFGVIPKECVYFFIVPIAAASAFAAVRVYKSMRKTETV